MSVFIGHTGRDSYRGGDRPRRSQKQDQENCTERFYAPGTTPEIWLFDQVREKWHDEKQDRLENLAILTLYVACNWSEVQLAGAIGCSQQAISQRIVLCGEWLRTDFPDLVCQ